MDNKERDNAISEIQVAVKGIETEMSNMTVLLADVKKHLFEPEHSLIVRVNTLENHHTNCMERQKEEKDTQQNEKSNKYSFYNIVIAALVLILTALTAYREFKPLVNKPPAVKNQ